MKETFSRKEKEFFDETRKAWEKVSESFRQEYERSRGDPRTVVAFLKADPRAIMEPWVTRELTLAIQEGRQTFLKSVWSAVANKRQNQKQVTAMHSLATMLEIDRLVARGQCRTQAEAFTFFTKAMQGLQPDQSWTFDRVKNEYFRARRRMPRVYIEERDGWTCVSAGPAMIEMNGQKYAGRWELRMRPDRQAESSFSIHPFVLTTPRVSRTPPS